MLLRTTSAVLDEGGTHGSWRQLGRRWKSIRMLVPRVQVFLDLFLSGFQRCARDRDYFSDNSPES